ncbi:helicase [Clostridium sp.]|uniref:helicase n=1 Tax=Clostridium sp. TaxID=1506 RepID=UPI003217CE22
MASKTANKKNKLTPFQQEQAETFKKINEFKEACEANIVGIIYKNPDYIREINLQLEEFTNNCWRVYFQIASDIINAEKKNSLDIITVNLYLEKHDKLRSKYEEYGAYELVENAGAYVKEENFDGYTKELHKWNAVIQLVKLGFPVGDKLNEYIDSSAEDIYNELEVLLNHIFVNIDSEIKTYNALEGLNELIDKLDKGSQVGLPLSNCEIVNKEIGGFNVNGNIYGLGANSGVGKSTTAINYLMPTVLKYDEKMVMMINEEDQTKVQKELLIWVANNVFKEELHKYVLRDGNFKKEVMTLLRKCANWLEEKKERRNITIIPFEKYTAKAAIKIIKKYSGMGVRIFILDTLKESSDSRGVDTWKSMERDMVDLYDVVKPAVKNVGLFVTYQLGKASVKLRYLTNNEIGQAKNILDVFSVNLMMRKPFEDEFEGGSHEIKGYKITGANGKTKIPFTLKKDQRYMITFITKNRFGSTDQFQVISEYDLSTNVHKDIGICNISQDW